MVEDGFHKDPINIIIKVRVIIKLKYKHYCKYLSKNSIEFIE